MKQHLSPGLHLIPVHGRHQDVDMIDMWGCKIVKSLSWDPAFVKSLFDRGAKYVVLRNHPRSEQHQEMAANPAALGREHARQNWVDWANMKKRGSLAGIELPSSKHFYFEGINEPWLDAGPRTKENINAWTAESWRLARMYDDYMEAFVKESVDSYGMHPSIFSVGVGWPANLNDGEDPFWGWFTNTLGLLTQRKYAIKVLVSPHVYWPDDGPTWQAPWHALRWMSFPREDRGRPINIWIWLGETGLDQNVKVGRLDYGQRGWKAFFGDRPWEYAEQWRQFWIMCQADDRFIGFATFTCDGDFRHWFSFDMLDVYSHLLKLDWPILDVVEKPVNPGVPPILSGVISPLDQAIPTQIFLDRWDYYHRKYGINGHNGLDIVPTNERDTQVVSVANGVVEWVGESKGYGLYVRIWHEALQVHTFYAHLDIQNVVGGEEVKRGYPIGRMGSTGDSTGPHLHFETRAGTRYNYKQMVIGHEKGRFSPSVFFYLHKVQFNAGP